MKNPSVSVILPVYNGAPYLRDAINSVLNQTYDDFELIIIDDGSKDESSSIIQQFDDNRIRFFSQVNMGLSATLNRAIRLSRGVYIARQDQDDLSFLRRFEKQVSFLDNHSDHGMVGTWAEIWEGPNKTERTHRPTTDSSALKFDLLFDNPFFHSTMMLRRDVFNKSGLYSTDTSRQPPEDYELWSRIARDFEVANIPDFLHVYREVPKSMSRNGINPFLDRVIDISSENLARAAGKDRPDQITKDLAALAHGAYYRVSPNPSINEICALLLEIVEKKVSSSGSSSDVLSEMAYIRMKSIKDNYFRYRYGYRFISIVSSFTKAIKGDRK